MVGISKGPRLLSFSYLDGPNLLYEDETDFGVGDWKLFGGHRFSLAPESDMSYYPDNEPCEVYFGVNSLTVQAPATPTGLQKSITIMPADNHFGFNVTHQLKNVGAYDWDGAIWAITCIPATGRIHSNIASDILKWPGTNPGPWQMDGSRIVIDPDGSRGKIGWYSRQPEIVSVTDAYEFTICAPDTVPISQCVDGGCNLEFFYCRDFYELETLGRYIVLSPGHSTTHVQQWRIRKR